MSKIEYLDALRQAMAGLPPETVAKTLAYYEQRFIEGLAAGLSEDDIARQLDEPRKIAMTLRANVHLADFDQRKNPVNLLRMMFSLIGLGIFNLFMVVPAMVYGALVTALYVSALALYVSGIAMTASGMAGVSELELNGPWRHLVIHDDEGSEVDTRVQSRLSISENGIEWLNEPDGHGKEHDDDSSRSERLLEGAESVAGHGVKISTDLDTDSRTTQTVVGVGIILLGIMLGLLSIVVTRFTLIGIKRYAQMNFALLRGR
jgi:uncharacterized membrane protein